MTLTSRFFANGQYYTQPDFAKLMSDSMGNGYVKGVRDELVVSATDPTTMSVTVGLGRGYIQGYSFDVEDTVYPVEISPADSNNPRIDRIVARLSVTANKNITLISLSGTPEASPTAPSLLRTSETYDISLAQVYVGAGVTSITSENITDERNDMLVCGVAGAKHNFTNSVYVPVDVSLIASGVADRDPVRFNGSQWVTDNSPAAFGVWDADTNTVIIEGYLEGFTGLTPGEYVNEIAYAISTTAVIVNGGGAYPTYTVFITQPQNGIISLDTPYTGPGGSITATIQPLSEAYIVGDVLVDGVSVGPVEQYIFSDMQENHRITAVMIEPPVYTVRLYKNKSATSGAGVLEVYSSNPADDLSTQTSREEIVKQYARHCLMTQNLGSVTYVNESNFAQDLDGNVVDLTGADGDFMLEIDRLYWDVIDNSSYWDIQFSKRKPTTLAVTAHTFSARDRKHIYIGVFNGLSSGGWLRSISSSSVPSNTQNIDWFYNQAHAGGAGMDENTYGITNAPERMLVGILHLFVYATKNMQDIVRGLNSGSGSSASALGAVNANFSPTGGWTQGTTANYTTNCMTLGLMNWYGKQWQFWGETIFNGGSWKVAFDAALHYAVASGTFAGAPAGWITVNAGTPTNMSQSYITEVSGNRNLPLVPTAASGGSASTFFADAAWSATGDRYCISGADVSAASGMAGLFALSVNYAVSLSAWSLGARLRAHSVD